MAGQVSGGDAVEARHAALEHAVIGFDHAGQPAGLVRRCRRQQAVAPTERGADGHAATVGRLAYARRILQCGTKGHPLRPVASRASEGRSER